MLIRNKRSGDLAAITDITRQAFASPPHGSQTEAAIIGALRNVGALTLSIGAGNQLTVVRRIDDDPRLGFARNPALTDEGHVTPPFLRQIRAGRPPSGRVSDHPGFAAF